MHNEKILTEKYNTTPQVSENTSLYFIDIIGKQKADGTTENIQIYHIKAIDKSDKLIQPLSATFMDKQFNTHIVNGHSADNVLSENNMLAIGQPNHFIRIYFNENLKDIKRIIIKNNNNSQKKENLVGGILKVFNHSSSTIPIFIKNIPPNEYRGVDNFITINIPNNNQIINTFNKHIIKTNNITLNDVLLQESKFSIKSQLKISGLNVFNVYLRQGNTQQSVNVNIITKGDIIIETRIFEGIIRQQLLNITINKTNTLSTDMLTQKGKLLLYNIVTSNSEYTQKIMSLEETSHSLQQRTEAKSTQYILYIIFFILLTISLSVYFFIIKKKYDL